MVTRRTNRLNDHEATFKNLLAYGYHIIHFFDPNAQGDLRFNYQSWYGYPYYILIFKIYHMNYLDQDFTELKHTDTLTPTYSEGSIPS